MGLRATSTRGGNHDPAAAPVPRYALTSNLVFIKIGAHNILITNPRRHAGFVKELKQIRFTGIIGVNTLYYACSIRRVSPKSPRIR